MWVCLVCLPAVPVDLSSIESGLIFLFFCSHTRGSHRGWSWILCSHSTGFKGKCDHSCYCILAERLLIDYCASYSSVWGDGLAAGAAGFFAQRCVFGQSWLGCDFGRSEHFHQVLHRERRYPDWSSSSFPLTSTVPTGSACISFTLQLLLTSYRLHLPHSPLFIADAQYLHEVQLLLLLTGRKKAHIHACFSVDIIFLGTERVYQQSRSAFCMKTSRFLCIFF